MRRVALFLILSSGLIFGRTFLVPEEYQTIQQAVISAENGDTVSVNFGRPNGQRTTVTTSRIFGKAITFEVRGEGRNELLEILSEMNNLPNTDNRPRQYPPPGWQGQRQVNEPDEIHDHDGDIIFDDQNRPWVLWGGKQPSPPHNLWAYYTYWEGQGWIGDNVAIAFPEPDRRRVYAPRATLGLEGQPFLVANIADPYNLNDIYYTHYSAYQSRWEPIRMVNLPDSTEYDFVPYVEANGNKMWVNWFGGPRTDSIYSIYVSQWNGNGWEPEEVISYNDNYHDWFQNLAVDRNGNPHIVWIALDIEPPYEDVVFYLSHDGNRWLEPETAMKGMWLQQGTHWSGVDICLDEADNPHVVFDAKDANAQSFDIYYAKKNNGRWGLTRITDDGYDDRIPHIALSDSHNIWIVWARREGYAHIIGRHYDGQNWSPEMTIDGSLSSDNWTTDLEFDPSNRLWLIYSGYPLGRIAEGKEIYYDVYSTSSMNEMKQKNKLQLRTIAPNPFSHHTTISYDLTKPTAVKIEIFDKLGKRVNLLETNFKLPGSFTINWTGKDQKGKTLPNGIYFVSLKLGKEKEVIPVIMIR